MARNATIKSHGLKNKKKRWINFQSISFIVKAFEQKESKKKTTFPTLPTTLIQPKKNNKRFSINPFVVLSQFT